MLPHCSLLPSCDADIKQKRGLSTSCCHSGVAIVAAIVQLDAIILCAHTQYCTLLFVVAFYATGCDMNEGLADNNCCCCSFFAVVVAIAQPDMLILCAWTWYLIVCHCFYVMPAWNEKRKGLVHNTWCCCRHHVFIADCGVLWKDNHNMKKAGALALRALSSIVSVEDASCRCFWALVDKISKLLLDCNGRWISYILARGHCCCWIVIASSWLLCSSMCWLTINEIPMPRCWHMCCRSNINIVVVALCNKAVCKCNCVPSAIVVING